MNNDIVTRLRECWCSIDYTSRSRIDPECDHDGVRAEAADEIQRLRARVDHWKLMYEITLKLYYNEHGRLPNE